MTTVPFPTLEGRIARCEERYAEFPIFHALGIDPPVLSEAECSQRWAYGPEHLGSNGTLHGGMLVVLADSLSYFIVLMATGLQVMITTDLQVQYMRACRKPVVASGRVLKAGRTFVTVQAEVQEEGGEIAALVIMKLLIPDDQNPPAFPG